ncbi:MAG: VOC family protein [Chloroflexi bacterium]|nr:VOC family protein [Chloroflexota bacterium]
MIELREIDHICLLVSDLANSREYYQKLFAVECSPHPRDPSALMVESRHARFFMKEIQATPDILGQQHLSFRVQSLAPVIEMLQRDNISYEVGVFTHFARSNYRWVEWRDPDGIRLECVELL